MPSLNKQPDAVMMAWYRARKSGPVRSSMSGPPVVAASGDEIVPSGGDLATRSAPSL